jgi:predicted alpha/beta hydrolase
VLMPAITRAVGYFPGRSLHLLDDLPSGVALEWASRTRPDFWWNKVLADGTPDTQWRNRMIDNFLAVRAPTLALRFTDDAFATLDATTRILGLYQNCTTRQIVFGPNEVGHRKIGHFGFFRSRFRDTLWPPVLAWLLNPPSDLQTVAEYPAPCPPR